MVFGHKYIEFSSKIQKITSLFFVIFYTVGVIGMALSFTFPLFVKLIPWALILSFGALVFFHTGKFEGKTKLIFLLIYIVAYGVEAIGVNTGQLFGHYTYGEGLGFKLVDTPLIIGINWLFLVYTTAAVVESFKVHALFKIVLASLGMLLYDIVLEQLAPKLDMWNWKNDVIPLQNYLAWFALALFFQSVLTVFRIKIKNKLALLILGCQFLFFLSLLILFKLTQ